MTDDPNIWKALNDLRERMARNETRGDHRDAVMQKIERKVDEMYDLAKQAEGAGKAARLFGKWGWGVVGFIGAGVMTFWREIIAVLFKH